ncbi:MAG TPA: RidA family protein [Candidatus Angelobacter sp.]|nr:RidA family protein [Candidatus Angelobacter sp.]
MSFFRYTSNSFTRRRFGLGLASLLPLGIAKTALARSTPEQESGAVHKMNSDGKPASGKDMITPIVAHNGLIYVAGQGAHDDRDPKEWTIDSHTTKVMDSVKKLVEAGGSNVDNIVQLTVFLAKIDDYDGMNKVFKTYFPHGGPARTTVAVAALPGNSLVEINCIAAVTHR